MSSSLESLCKCLESIQDTKVSDSVILPTKASGPCCFVSLSKNDSPPFKKPTKVIKPQIVTDTFLSDNEIIGMIAADDENGNRKHYLGNKLFEKGITTNYETSERKFLISMLLEAIDFGAAQNFNSVKLRCLLAIYVASHKFFKNYYWQSPESIWQYFKELMIRHTIEDFPDGQGVFSPQECYSILDHFHKIYINNLPLIHIVTFGTTKIKFTWPFTRKII